MGKLTREQVMPIIERLGGIGDKGWTFSGMGLMALISEVEDLVRGRREAQPAPLHHGQSFDLNEEDCKFLIDMLTSDPDEITRIGFRIGHVKDEDGTVEYGLCVYESEYPEEGLTLLVKCDPPNHPK